MNVISVERITKRFFRYAVLDDVSFTIPRATITGLLGENGAGKTTLMHIILGLLEPDSGAATIFSIPSQTAGVEIRRRTGYVPDSFQLYEWMTVTQLCSFIGPFYPTWDQGHADNLIGRMKLPRSKKINSFSRGMKTRLLLIIALAHHPELMVLDEPLAGLDPVVREDVLTLLSEFAAEHGKTVFISSHQLADIERICDRVILLHHHRILLDDFIHNLKENRGELRVTFPGAVPSEFYFNNARIRKRSGNSLTIYYRKNRDRLVAHCVAQGAQIEAYPLDLETIFKREVQYDHGTAP